MWDWKSDPEAPWWVKLRRARLHIDEVHQRVRVLNASNPWSVDMELAEDPDSWVFRFRIQHPIPADLCAAVGDAIANMRSALDYVAYELAVRHIGTLAPRQEMATAFPAEKASPYLTGWNSGPIEVSRANDFVYFRSGPTVRWAAWRRGPARCLRAPPVSSGSVRAVSPTPPPVICPCWS